LSTKLPIENIHALTELERLNWPFEPQNDNEVNCKCPVHEDKTPSLQLNTERNVWKCQAATCGAKGDIISLIQHIIAKKEGKHVDRASVVEELSNRYELTQVKAVNQELIERWHEKVWSAGPLLAALRKRAITDDMLREARIGYNDGRITIPVYDKDRNVVNVRLYKPGAPGPEKMRNLKGYSQIRLFQVEQTEFPTVMICGGECKALVAKHRLNKFGVGAVAVTAGEGAWDRDFNKLLKGKKVLICMDIDLGGKTAARKVAAQICYDAESVEIIQLPLDINAHPKGDINDWEAQGRTDDDWAKLIQSGTKYVSDLLEDDIIEPIAVEVKLSQAAKAENVGKKIIVEAVVQSMDEAPYLAPRTVKVNCAKDQQHCHWCPVRPIDPDPTTGMVTLTVKGTAFGILSVVNAPAAAQRQAIFQSLRMPPCRTAVCQVVDHHDVIDVKLTPQLQIGGDNSDHVTLPAMVVGHKVELNTPYTFSGRVFPHPRNQQACLLLDEVSEAKDSLLAYTPQDSELEPLDIFKGSAEEQLKSIYDDFEANVTHIYFRPDLHLLIDLTYHSPLYMVFDGQHRNGWVNSLIVGDSSQGKSEATQMLMRHYGLGERVDCKNATTAGLLGGLQQSAGNRWWVSWGAIPTHDRRLVVCEEIKGTPIEVLGKLTDMRSSGFAQIPKIEKRMAHARTRLLMISNPRSDRPVSAYNFGIETVLELMGSLEDVRRFDVALVMSANEIDPSQISKLAKNKPQHPHLYTSDLCRKLILWAWTRTADQVRIDRDAEIACIDHAASLCSEFSEALPLVDRGTMRFKIARLSCALAARLFSTEEGNRQILKVTIDHVNFIYNWLKRMYGSSVFGYKDFSAAQKFADSIIDGAVVRRNLLATKHPKDLVDHLLHADEVTLIDLQDWCEVDGEIARGLLSMLVRKHALYRVKRWYVKTPEFITLLKDMKMGKIPATGVANADDEY